MESISRNISEVCIGDFLSSCTFSLLSRHASVANYTHSNSQLVFVTKIPNFIAPNSIFIPFSDFEFPQSVTICADRIIVGTINIVRSNAQIFHSHCSFAAASAKMFEKRLFRFVESNSDAFPQNSLMHSVFLPGAAIINNSFQSVWIEKVQSATQLLIQGKVLDGVKLLKGMGVGSTPSGDDFIAGFLYGLHYRQQVYDKENALLMEQVLAEATGSNLISNAMLLNACNGRYFLSLKNFIEALYNDTNPQVSFQALLAHGATSGADILSGFLFAIKHRTH